MKRGFAVLAALALVASGFQLVPAAAADPVAAELKFFLGSTGCPPVGGGDFNDYLSIVDAEDEVECNYTASGIRNEVGNTTGTHEAQGQRPLSARAEASRYWETLDGGPIALDATRPITGQIFTSGASCYGLVGMPCAPSGVSAGEVILDITVVGISAGKEVELGAQTDTFQVKPGDVHATEVKIQAPAETAGVVFESIELRTWIHGKSQGHGVIKTTGDANSFVSILTAPAKPKGCTKGKGKKKGCTKPRP